MNYGSVCSGVEAATLAWEPLGWKAKFFAEVEPFPAAVLCHRFGATRPLRPLDPAEAEDEKERKLRENWKKQIAELPSCGMIPNLGDFTKIKETDYDGKIDLLVGGTPCFPAGNLILTEFGYKPIEAIQVGDRVVTHLGRLRCVLATGSKVTDNVGRCRIVGRPEFSVTGNHPFFVSKGRIDHRRHAPTFLHLLLNEPEFQTIENSVGMYAGRLNVLERKCDIPMPDLPAVYSASPQQIIELCGWYVGDGYIRGFTGKNKKTVVLCLSPSKLENFKKSFGNSINFCSVADQNGVFKVQVSCTALAEFLLTWFGKLAEHKTIPAWIYGLDAQKLQAFVNGYKMTDGHRTPKGYGFTTISRSLAYGVADITTFSSINRVDVQPTKEICGRIVNQKPWYRIDQYDAAKARKSHRLDQWIFGKIRYFHPTGIPETVYNLEVEDDHTYIANGLCVHNCQDMSVAGKRLGFNGKRSVLALDFVRLCFESGTRWICWENVPAALSSQGGRDFARFISLLCGWEVPVPDGGWRKAGIVVHAPGGYGAAWRILDAQYTRVPEFPGAIPQRRKRLFLIGYFDSWRYPAKVLFDGEMRGGNTPPRREKGQNAARTITASTGGVSGKEQGATFIDASGTPLNALCMAHGQANAEISEENAPTLSCNHEAPVVSFYSQRKVESISPIADVANTLTNGSCPGFTSAICYDARGNGNGEIVNTITGNHAGHVNDYMPLVAFTANDNGRDCLCECSPTLRKGGETPTDGGAIVPAIVESEPLAFIKNDAGGDQDGYWRGIFPTLRTEITPAIAYNVTFCDANGCRQDRPNGGLYVTEADTGKTVTAGGPNTEMLVVDPLETPIAYNNTSRNSEPIPAALHGFGGQCRATVRRLLPVECERLMGFPDHHTRISWQGKPEDECPDSARYKACGNSMAVNVMSWLGHRIQTVERTIRNQLSKETL